MRKGGDKVMSDRKNYFCFLLFLLSLHVFAEQIVTLEDGKRVILFDDFTWRYFEQEPAAVDYSKIRAGEIPPYLRRGIKATPEEIGAAIEMYNQGWRYTMPHPKSAQAAWGNSDGRTTWWYGWWSNEKTGLYSHTTPRKSSSGLYLGDNQNNSGRWRNGGSRDWPDVYMFLLSKNGGPVQR
jgi:hypothetical protein